MLALETEYRSPGERWSIGGRHQNVERVLAGHAAPLVPEHSSHRRSREHA